MSTIKALISTTLLVLLAGFWALPAHAAWSQDPTENTPFCTESGDLDELRAIADGSGGCFLVWEDDRFGELDIFAQHIDAAGDLQWGTHGMPVCRVAGEQRSPDLVSDGAGGIIVGWTDYRNGGASDIYAQRVGSNGVVQWATGGVVISDEFLSQFQPRMISDGAGGAIICWTDARNQVTNCTDIYAQLVNGAGVGQWTVDGVSACSATGCQGFPEITSDGAGGAVIVWEDQRDGDRDLYTQHLDATGAVQWTTTGKGVCQEPSEQNFPQLVLDGSGGVIIGWVDGDNGSYDIYAQRLDASGALQWADAGLPVSTAANNQWRMRMIADGSGGAILTWHDLRPGAIGIYAQRINVSGNQLWTVGGATACTEASVVGPPGPVTDGAGGVVIAWADARNYIYDIYAQRLDHHGVMLWAAEGVVVCGTDEDQDDPVIVADGAAGAIVAWEDMRDSGADDGYAQWVDADGYPGGPPANTPPVAAAGADPSAGYVALDVYFHNSSWDADGDNLDYFWDFGDPDSSDNTSTLRLPQHTYENPGIYRATLTASDGEDEDSCFINVTVWEPTISAAMGCLPCSGTAPFSTRFRATIINERDDENRRVAARINILLANGSPMTNWRAGSTNLSPGETYNSSWYSTIPATGSVIGQNWFTLELEDVTPVPYNQPPYAPAGDVDQSAAIVTAFAP